MDELMCEMEFSISAQIDPFRRPGDMKSSRARIEQTTTIFLGGEINALRREDYSMTRVG